MSPDYGAERRRLRVIKYRAQGFRGGYHDFVIRRGGAQVFPRLVAAEHRRDFERGRIGSGIAGLDTLLGGGVEQRFEHPADRPGRRGQEPDRPAVRGPGDPRRRQGRDVHLRRGAGASVRSRQAARASTSPAMQAGGQALAITQLDAAELSPGEFAHNVRDSVRDGDVTTVVIDSLNGYQASMPQENSLILHMHELLQFLQSPGRVDLPDGRPAWPGRRHEIAGRRHLPCRLGDHAALLRGARLGAARHLGHQEAHRQARGHDPRILDRRRTACRRAARRVPWRAARHALSCTATPCRHGRRRAGERRRPDADAPRADAGAARPRRRRRRFPDRSGGRAEPRSAATLPSWSRRWTTTRRSC